MRFSLIRTVAICLFSLAFACPISTFAQAPTTIEGRLEIRIAEDPVVHKMQYEQAFIVNEQETRPVNLDAISKLTVHSLLNKEVVVELGASGIQAMSNSNSEVVASSIKLSPNYTPPPPKILAFGDGTETRTIAVVILDFVDASAATDASGARNTLFNGTFNVADHYLESTKGKLTFDGDVIGRTSVSTSETDSCTNSRVTSWMTSARNFITNQGINESDYDHVMVILPRAVETSMCGWAGLATLGGRYIWIARNNLIVKSHELGHNLGFHHAATPSLEYGDHSDPMGNNLDRKHFGAPHGTRWFEEDGKILELSGSFNETIDVIAVEEENEDASLPQYIKINLPGVQIPYYISFRKNIGDYSDLDINNHHNKLHVHRWGGNRTRSYLVANVGSGILLGDSLNAVRIRMNSFSGSVASITIERDEDLVDTDLDGIPDIDDNDDDGDGVDDVDDCAPLDDRKYNSLAYRDSDTDGFRNSTQLVDTGECFRNFPPAYYTLDQTPLDNCPFDYNDGQEDLDGDGTGDVCDSDIDGDGVNNSNDCSDYNASLYRNRAAVDSDGDTISDTNRTTVVACYGDTPPTGYVPQANGPDNCPDDANEDQADLDNDDIGDVCDSDRDGDGVPNASDCAPNDVDTYRNQAAIDSDGDDISDGNSLVTVACYGESAPAGYHHLANGPDNCPNDANQDQADLDNDDIGDVCDPDRDGDDVANGSDCAPDDANKYQNQAARNSDGDTISNTANFETVSCFGETPPAGYQRAANGPDNCPNDTNQDQADLDNDDIGDVCDSDKDGDGRSNASDCAPNNSSTFQNQGAIDIDKDGVSDSDDLETVACFGAVPPEGVLLEANGPDNCPETSNTDQRDTNNNGIGDVCDAPGAPLDFNGDGISDVGYWTAGSSPTVDHVVSMSPEFDSETVLITETGSFPAHADYDGDGTTDVAIVQESSGEIVWTYTPSSDPENPQQVTFGRTDQGFRVGVLTGCDFDGDNKADPTTVTMGIVRSLLSLDNKSYPIAVFRGGTLLDIACANVDSERGDELFAVEEITYNDETELGTFRVTASDAYGNIKRQLTLDGQLRAVHHVTAVDTSGNGEQEVIVWVEESNGAHVIRYPFRENSSAHDVGIPRTAGVTVFREDASSGEDDLILAFSIAGNTLPFRLDLETGEVHFSRAILAGEMLHVNERWDFE